MHETPHGHFSIHWYGQICVVCLAGTFNRPAARAMQAALVASWEKAGRPTRWAHIVDMRVWEGGTPESFATGRSMAEWSFAHGVAVVIRLHHGAFLTRVVDRQGVLDAAPVPVLDCSEIPNALEHLAAFGFGSTALGNALMTPECGSAPADHHGQ